MRHDCEGQDLTSLSDEELRHLARARRQATYDDLHELRRTFTEELSPVHIMRRHPVATLIVSASVAGLLGLGLVHLLSPRRAPEAPQKARPSHDNAGPSIVGAVARTVAITAATRLAENLTSKIISSYISPRKGS